MTSLPVPKRDAILHLLQFSVHFCSVHTVVRAVLSDSDSVTDNDNCGDGNRDTKHKKIFVNNLK